MPSNQTSITLNLKSHNFNQVFNKLYNHQSMPPTVIAIASNDSHKKVTFFVFIADRKQNRNMLKFIRGKGQQPSAERQKLQKELFSYRKVSKLILIFYYKFISLANLFHTRREENWWNWFFRLVFLLDFLLSSFPLHF